MIPVTAVLWAQYFFITSNAEATCQLVLQTEESNIKDVLRWEREGKVGRGEMVLHCRVLYFCVLFQFVPQVLIPVFALGRAQELCILLESFWQVVLADQWLYIIVRRRVHENYGIQKADGPGLQCPSVTRTLLRARGLLNLVVFIGRDRLTILDCSQAGRGVGTL